MIMDEGCLMLASILIIRNAFANMYIFKNRKSTSTSKYIKYFVFGANVPNVKLAIDAVIILLVQRMRAWFSSKRPSWIQPRTKAPIDARKPTTIAWHWKIIVKL